MNKNFFLSPVTLSEARSAKSNGLHKKFIFIFLLIAPKINCMNFDYHDFSDEKIESELNSQEYVVESFKKLSIKPKIQEFFDENNINPAQDLAEIISAYTGQSNEEKEALKKILEQGILSNNLEMVKTAISLGVDVNAEWDEKFFKGCFPLALAVNQHRFAIVRLLLESGADINKKIKNEYYVERIAAFNEEGDLMRDMIRTIRSNVPLSTDMLEKIEYVESLPVRTLYINRENHKIKQRCCVIL